MKFKANKVLKTFKILLIIILCIVLVISLLKYFDLYTEGFSSNEELANYDISQLDNEQTCSSGDSNVPACYATVQPGRGNDYLNHDDSDYILKTQIETPVCPNSPYEYGNNNGFGSILSDTNHIVTPEDSWLSRSKDISSNTFNIPSSNTVLSSNSTPSTIESPFTIQDDLATSSAQNNSSGLNDLNLTYPILPTTPEPSTTDTMTSSKTSNGDKCPPCPACQRCPEPVIECKKVVNYTNASSAGKLPVPYINDFSKF